MVERGDEGQLRALGSKPSTTVRERKSSARIRNGPEKKQKISNGDGQEKHADIAVREFGEHVHT